MDKTSSAPQSEKVSTKITEAANVECGALPKEFSDEEGYDFLADILSPRNISSVLLQLNELDSLVSGMESRDRSFPIKITAEASNQLLQQEWDVFEREKAEFNKDRELFTQEKELLEKDRHHLSKEMELIKSIKERMRFEEDRLLNLRKELEIFEEQVKSSINSERKRIEEEKKRVDENFSQLRSEMRKLHQKKISLADAEQRSCQQLSSITKCYHEEKKSKESFRKQCILLKKEHLELESKLFVLRGENETLRRQITHMQGDVMSVLNIKQDSEQNSQIVDKSALFSKKRTALDSFGNKKVYADELSVIGMNDNILSGLLAGFSKLERLDIRSNKLFELPDDISALTDLKSICLSNNDFTSLPHQLIYLTNLCSISLIENPVKTLPSWITKLKKLSSLDLGSSCQDVKAPASLTTLPCWTNASHSSQPYNLKNIQLLADLDE